MNKTSILLILFCPVCISAGVLYRNNLKNRFLATSALPHNPNQNSEEPPCQNSDSSGYFCISSTQTQKRVAPVPATSKLFNPQSIRNSKRVWLEADALIWKASEDDLQYATTSKSQTRVQDGHIKAPDFEWDGGLRLGLGIKLPYFDSLWGLGGGWGLFGNGAASMLVGDFTVRQREKLKEADLTRLNFKAEMNTIVAIAELALGLQWDKLFAQDHYHLGFKFGWELNVFFDQNRLVQFLGSTPGAISQSDANFSFQGLTIGLRFDF